jgi:hypothetical protein
VSDNIDGSAIRRTIESSKAHAGTALTNAPTGTIAGAHLPTIELGESMRYKAIAAFWARPLLVTIGLGGDLCAPAQGDDNLIHHRCETERTNRPRPHHVPRGVSVSRQKQFITFR